MMDKICLDSSNDTHDDDDHHQICCCYSNGYHNSLRNIVDNENNLNSCCCRSSTISNHRDQGTYDHEHHFHNHHPYYDGYNVIILQRQKRKRVENGHRCTSCKQMTMPTVKVVMKTTTIHLRMKAEIQQYQQEQYEYKQEQYKHQEHEQKQHQHQHQHQTLQLQQLAQQKQHQHQLQQHVQQQRQQQLQQHVQQNQHKKLEAEEEDKRSYNNLFLSGMESSVLVLSRDESIDNKLLCCRKTNINNQRNNNSLLKMTNDDCQIKNQQQLRHQEKQKQTKQQQQQQQLQQQQKDQQQKKQQIQLDEKRNHQHRRLSTTTQRDDKRNSYCRINLLCSSSFVSSSLSSSVSSIFWKVWMLSFYTLFVIVLLDTISVKLFTDAYEVQDITKIKTTINTIVQSTISNILLSSGTRQLTADESSNQNNNTFVNWDTPMQYQLDCDPCTNRNSYTIHAILHSPAPPLSLASDNNNNNNNNNNNMNYYQTYINSWKQQIIKSMNQSAYDMGITFIIDFINIGLDDNNNIGINQMKSFILKSLSNTAVHGLIVSIPDDNSIEEFYTNSIRNHTKPIYIMNLFNNEHIQSYHIQGSISYDLYQIGKYAANEFINYYNTTTTDTINTTIYNSMNHSSAVFVQMNLLPSLSLQQQTVLYDSFRNTILSSQNNDTNNIVDIIYIDNPYDIIQHQMTIEQLLNDSCQYDMILLSSELSIPYAIVAKTKFECFNTQIGVVDMSSTNPVIYDYLSKKSILFAMDSQIYIQSSLLIILLSLNIMTGMQLPIPSASSFMKSSSSKNHSNDSILQSYITSPVMIRQDSIVTDTYQNLRSKAFPICDLSISSSYYSTDHRVWTNKKDGDVTDDSNTIDANLNQNNLAIVEISSSSSKERLSSRSSYNDSNSNNNQCIDRASIRIGAVLHGDTSDVFWDTVYASARQAAHDMNIQLDMIRFQPQLSNDILYQKMSIQIRTLCESNIDGIFVTIPNETLIESIQICKALNIPVLSINTGKDISEQLQLYQHTGQDEYVAGKKAAQIMIVGGMKYGYCMDHTKQIDSVVQRCLGFQNEIKSMNNSNIQYMGIFQVPVDNRAQYKAVLESIISESISHNIDNNDTYVDINVNDNWNGIGILGMGPAQIEGLRDVALSHPNVIAGTFDVSPEISNGLKEKWLSFAIDQQHYYQGNLPVYLLTNLAYTKQSLLNSMIETGPGVVTHAPSDAKLQCESNFYEVCLQYPKEDMNMIPNAYLALGYTMFAIISLMCTTILIWTYVYRHKRIVSVGQPNLLALVVIGCLISSLSIVFMGIQTTCDGNSNEDEEVQEDLGTRYMTTTSMSTSMTTLAKTSDCSSPSLSFVNASCMAVPWLYGTGFILTFSTLFAKVQRVKLIYVAGLKMQRRTIGIKDVLYVMAFLLCIELVILICWQAIDPLQWYREVLEYDRGYPTDSVGKCTSASSNGWIFIVVLLAFHVMCLFYALILCYQTKDLNSDFAESSYIALAVAFMFQILILVLPISMLVINSTAVFYFMKVCAVFFQNSSVLLFLFLPKMVKFHCEKEENPKDTVSVTDLSAKNIGERVVYSHTSLRRISTGSKMSGLSCINSFKVYDSFKKYDKKPNTARQFSMFRQSMNNKAGKLLPDIPDIDPDDMKIIEAKLKRSIRVASVLTNYDLSSCVGYVGQLNFDNSNSKVLSCIGETSSIEALDMSSTSMFKYFSEHNVPISDDVMPIMDDNNMPIEINDLSVSNNLSNSGDDDNKSDHSYDLMGDISEQKVKQERYHYSSRFSKSDSNFWKIDEEDSSLSDGENGITHDSQPNPESINSSRQRTDYRTAYHNSRSTVVIDEIDDDDIDDIDIDPVAGVISNQKDEMMEYMNRSLMDLSSNGTLTTNNNSRSNRKKESSRSPSNRRSKTPEKHRRFRGSNRSRESDPRKSGSSGIISTSDDSQIKMMNNRKNTSTTISLDDFLVSSWKEFGFKSQEQAEILMSIASTTISSEERRRLCSNVEIINDLP